MAVENDTNGTFGGRPTNMLHLFSLLSQSSPEMVWKSLNYILPIYIDDRIREELRDLFSITQFRNDTGN